MSNHLWLIRLITVVYTYFRIILSKIPAQLLMFNNHYFLASALRVRYSQGGSEVKGEFKVF